MGLCEWWCIMLLHVGSLGTQNMDVQILSGVTSILLRRTFGQDNIFWFSVTLFNSLQQGC